MNISPEIIAAIIGIVGGALLTIGGYLIKSHKGNKVFFEKVNESSLIQLSNQISKDLVITYKGVPVDKLIFYEYILYNAGDKDISGFKVNVEFLPDNKEFEFFIESITSDPQGITEDLLGYSPNGNRMLIIERPYLNRRSQHKNEVLHIQIFSGIRLRFIVTGGGEGWSGEYSEKKEARQTIARILLISFILGSVLAALSSFINNYPPFLTTTGYIIIILSGLISFIIPSPKPRKKRET